MKDPDFIIAGEHRCGSTSLFECLLQHPEIQAPLLDSNDLYQYDKGTIYLRQKEIRFFDRNWELGIDWYRSLFLKNVISGDGSVSYVYDPIVVKRFHQMMPNAKVIILLRNPVDRAISHYSHFTNINQEFKRKYPSFEDFFKKSENKHQIIDRGIYIKSLTNYFNLFSKEQTLVLQSEVLFKGQSSTINSILDFIGAKRLPLDFPKVRSSNCSEIDPSTYRTLCDFYEPYNQELYTSLGRNFNWNDIPS